MARGDQRERDRAKKQARLQKEAKGGGAKVSWNINMNNIWRNIRCSIIVALTQVQLRPHYSIVWEVQTAWNIEDIKYSIIVPQKCGPILLFYWYSSSCLMLLRGRGASLLSFALSCWFHSLYAVWMNVCTSQWYNTTFQLFIPLFSYALNTLHPILLF